MSATIIPFPKQPRLSERDQLVADIQLACTRVLGRPTSAHNAQRLADALSKPPKAE